MRTVFFTALMVGCSAICNAQEKQSDTTKVKFKPPVIVKDEPSKGEVKEVVKFVPPVIVKDKTPKGKKHKEKEKVNFTPGIVIEQEKKQ